MNYNPNRHSGRAMLSTLHLLLVFFVGFLLSQSTAAAQSEPPAKIAITDSNSNSAPSIQLRVYGRDSAGNPVDFETIRNDITVTHGDQTVQGVTVVGREEVGTFTVFLLDTPPGVADELPNIQGAISQFATDFFTEPIDRAAVYNVAITTANQLLEPTEFRNTILNLFADPIEVQEGPTALVDSIMGLLNQLESIQPLRGQATSLVIFSDGTDVVSRQFAAEDVATKAAELGVVIHTIVLDNIFLPDASEGEAYMLELAALTGGRSVAITNPEAIGDLWRQINQFQHQTLIRYTVPNVSGGDFPVTLSAGNASAATTISINGSAPSVTLDVPTDATTLTLPALSEPIALRLPISVRWLDGVERTLTQAQLLVNGQVIQELDVENLAQTDVEIPNFSYGSNRLQIAVADDQLGRATSPELVLTVNAGEETLIPEPLQPAGGSFIWLWLLFLLALLGLSGFILWRSGRLPQMLARATAPRRTAAAVPYPTPEPAPTNYERSERRPRTCLLEVLSSVSRVNNPIELTGVEMRIGRSTSQADIVFENDITVSRIHASLVREGLDYRLFDEQSTSGTYVNDIPVPEYGVQLMDGDEITLGAVRLRYRKT